MRDLLRLMSGRDLVLSEERWRAVLDLADRTQATTTLTHVQNAPAWFRDAVADRARKTRERRGRLLRTYREATIALEHAGVEFVLLKGFTHEADAGWKQGMRVQNDIDLLCAASDLARAEAALLTAGFVFHPGSELSDNHGRPLLKPHNWTWRGDYFDPELPVCIELHHTIWSSTRDRIEIPGVNQFWDRRRPFELGGSTFQDADRLGIAALHLLRHILRNNVRPAQAHELAQMVALREGDDAFWLRWQQHPAELRALESIAMQFAVTWFRGRLPASPQEAWDDLSPQVHHWFEMHAFAPMENLTSPNKDVLWLHLALLENWRDRLAVARRRLLPSKLPGVGQATGAYSTHVFQRARYHAVALARVAWGTLRPSVTRSTASHTSD